ncbi:MAG TPA: hypothetical protein VGY77_10370 [Gemmataceae bacterium]|jgi:hypothetical protein|nr:hypothetical protein [Gemmataceae bacterium]
MFSLHFLIFHWKYPTGFISSPDLFFNRWSHATIASHGLLCKTPVPGMEEFPVDERTHHGGSYYPTINEEPLFENVVWINQFSKEATRVRQGRGGSSGMSGFLTKTFGQFLALKCFDILKRLWVRQKV